MASLTTACAILPSTLLGYVVLILASLGSSLLLSGLFIPSRLGCIVKFDASLPMACHLTRSRFLICRVFVCQPDMVLSELSSLWMIVRSVMTMLLPCSFTPNPSRAPRMREALIKYEEQPRSKSLPKRGTIFPSRSEAVAFNSVKWILINLVLFLLPSASALTALVLLGSRLGTSTRGSPHDLAFFIAYLAVCSGSWLVFSGSECDVRNSTSGPLLASNA
ncbi:hypothetical protein B0H11DRAFT_1918028 [Mycena galericulata]|nr:hypothetical protein B0H11DRAFT_1918028 [Mycena galericulata]